MPQVTTMYSPSTINVDTIEDITDPVSIAVDISASGDDTIVTPTETVDVSVVVDYSEEGVYIHDSNNLPTLQYKIGESGTPAGITLGGGNRSELSGSLTVTSLTAAGAFIFISVNLHLNNANGDETPETRVYDSSSTPVPSVTDAGLTIKTVADPMSIAVDISADGDGDRVTDGENITVAVVVTDDDATSGFEGKHDGSTAAPVLTYKIGDGDNQTLTLMDNTTHWIVVIGITASFTGGDGVFTFVSLTLSLKNVAGATAVRTYVADDVVLTPTDENLIIGYPVTDPNLATLDVNITADGDDALGVDDKITFTAKVSNNTDGNVLSVKVHYMINKTNDSIVLVKGDDGTWSAVLTIKNTTASGNLTFVSVEIGLENRGGTDTATRTYDASQAMIKGALNITIDASAPVDNPTSSASATSSAGSASSSETSSDSPVSIFAVFILIASVSMAVGVYTLRRRQ